MQGLEGVHIPEAGELVWAKYAAKLMADFCAYVAD
jgi:hypothetical protein